MEKLFSNQYANLSLPHTAHNTVERQWLDFVPSVNFQPTVLKMRRLCRQHRVLAPLADNRLLRALRQAGLEWCGGLVVKGLYDLGGRRFAVVKSLDAMNRMGVSALIASAVPGAKLTSQFFSPTAEARTWSTQPF